MKTIRITVLLVFTITLNLAAQKKTLNINTLKKKQLMSILCNLDTSIIKSNDNLSVRLYVASNKSGSAKLKESDEVSKLLLMAVSSIDDAPTQKIFTVNNLIYPKIVAFVEETNNNYLLTIEFGVVKKRTKKTINISLNKCFFIE